MPCDMPPPAEPGRDAGSSRPQTLVVGCGSSISGDDAAGPEVVRRLNGRGLPEEVECVDAGTNGFEVALRMRSAAEVILVDACLSGGEPGTIRELNGEPTDGQSGRGGVSIHSLRWDQAIALSRSLSGGGRPARLTVFLIEGRRFEPGDGLSPEVDRAVDRLADRLVARLGEGA